MNLEEAIVQITGLEIDKVTPYANDPEFCYSKEFKIPELNCCCPVCVEKSKVSYMMLYGGSLLGISPAKEWFH